MAPLDKGRACEPGWKPFAVFGLVSLLAATPPSFAQSEDNEDNEEPLAIDEIVVHGIRSTLVNSLAEKRNSDQIIDTLSAVQADRFPDRNVAEALQRLPGVSFIPEQATGLGEFISIRGMSSGYNNVQFDGVNAGSTSRNDRKVGLSAASANNVSEVRISKALLASNDSEGIGGSVNIITRTALDTRRDRFFFSGEGRVNEFIDDTGYEYQLGFSKLVSDNFGIDFSALKDRRFVRNIQNNAANAEIFRFPSAADVGTLISAGEDDFRNVFNRTVGLVSADDVEMEDVEYVADEQIRDGLSLSGSLAWQATDSTRFSLIGRSTERESTSLESFMDFDTDDNCDIDAGTAQCIFDDPEIRIQPEVEDQINRSISILLKGETSLDNASYTYYASYAQGREDQNDWELRFRGQFGDDESWIPHITGSPGFASPDLNAAQAAFVGDPSSAGLFASNVDILDNQKDDRYAAGFDADWEVSGLGPLKSIQAGLKIETSETQRNRFKGCETDDCMRPDGTFDPDFGSFSAGDAGLFSGAGVPLDDVGNPMASLGVTAIPRVDEGTYRAMRDRFRRTFVDAVNAGVTDYAVKEFRETEEDVFNAYVQAHFEFRDDLELIAGVRFDYIDGEYANTFSPDAIVDIEAMDSTSANADLLLPVSSTPGTIDPSELQFSARSEFELLPRIVLTWRSDERWVLRGAYTTSIARPNLSRISRLAEEDNEFTLEFEPAALATIDSNSTLADILGLGLTVNDLSNFDVSIDVGNPDLENTYSHNIDFAVEYYLSEDSAITAGLFYKHIENFIFDPVYEDGVEGVFETDPATLLAGLELSADGQALVDSLGGFDALLNAGLADISVFQPANGRDADVFGVELGYVMQFSKLPPPWNGLGFFGNATYIDSEAESVVGRYDSGDWAVIVGEAREGQEYVRKTDFFAQPDLIANVALFYDKGPLEASLSYYYQGSQLLELDDFGVDNWQQSFDRWDFSVEYEFPVGENAVTLYFNARDFTDDGDKPTIHETYGTGTRLNDVITFNGREFILGISGRFGG